jgi:RNA polymerase sigma-70 factor (ECF subfamily)
MARAQNGDRRVYGRLLEEIVPYLRALAARRGVEDADLEDFVQDILLTVHAIRHTYDPARPFGPWLVAIAHRRITDGLRRRTRRRAREMPLNPTHETFAAAPANLGEVDANSRALMEEIEKLPSGQRLALRLLKLEERSLKDAAAACGRSVGSLKVASHRAIRTLQRVFARRGHET